MAKLLLQELWRIGCGWDEEIPDKYKDQWMKWLAGAEQVSSIQINRRYHVDDRPISEVQLHIFCDASELAFASVGYLRLTLKDGDHVCSFVMSKSRLAPIKTITLPRLELNAAVIGARLSRLLVHEMDLPIERIQYWTDSTLVLQYIQNTVQRTKIFVANRVTEIRETSSPESWSHVPGDQNPADIASRGVINPRKLMDNDWFTGPAFLRRDEEHWPNLAVGEIDSDDPEIRKRSVLVAMCTVEETGIDLKRFSNWLRLRRVVAYVLRFVTNCTTPSAKRSQGCELTVKELDAAELCILKEVQQVSFDDELRLIRNGTSVPQSSRLSALCPYLDQDGTLRVGGRLKHIDIPHRSKHQPILPKNHQVTKIIIDWVHRRNGHVGPEHVLSLLREQYWVLSGRTVIRSVLARCFFCQIRRALRQFPMMADLPLARAAFGEPPFANCGVDLFGPIVIKQGRKQLKRWAVLFTCLTVRCVHLEVVDSCETDAFINALRRFVNRRGCPSDMYSDNGNNFKGATSELREFVRSIDQKAVNDFATTLKIDWHFNPPKAPHMGGTWERLVRSVKEVMTGLVKDHVLTDPQLYTLLTEAEYIVNSRPLTHISDDINDMEALTPNHILLGLHRNWASIDGTNADDITSRRMWKQVQALRAKFWTRWTKEYLPCLTKRACWRKNVPNVVLGDLVLVQDEELKRKKWPLARVTKILPGKDDVVRVVEVKTKSGVYTRPVAKLFRLEHDDD